MKAAETLFIDSTALPRERMPGGGEMTEILNDALAGARNVVGTLRWLHPGDTYEAAASARHQLMYVMDGAGGITIDGRTHEVAKGMGVYLEPSESATVRAAADASLKLFHLEVPHLPEAPRPDER